MTFIRVAGLWHQVRDIERDEPHWHPRIIGETGCEMSVLVTDHIVTEPDDGPWCPECCGHDTEGTT